jgi:hypothetical protein
MTTTQTALGILLACLRSEPFDCDDWMEVVALANRCWLGPALSSAVARLPDAMVPRDVRAYLGFLYELNRQRNLKLRAQLIEAGAALNAAGILPTLLNGSAPILLASDESSGARMTTDLDLGIEPSEVVCARSVLISLGYADAEGTRGMWRPQDAGVLELRDSPSEFTRAYYPKPTSDSRSIVSWGGAQMWLQSATERAHHWIVHDMIKEGYYVRGRIDLRHLYDLSMLAEAPGGVDWHGIWRAMPNAYGRNAVATQLMTLHILFGVEVPETLLSVTSRLQHWRRLFASTRPIAGRPMMVAGNMVWAARRLLDSKVRFESGADLVMRARRTLQGAGGSRL